MMLVLNKPAGIAVHAGSGKSNALDQYFDDLRFGLPAKPSLAHRLDKQTSGCLVMGRHPKAIKRLGHLFMSHQAQKTYIAIVHGTPSELEGIIDIPLAQENEDKRSWRMIGHPEGKETITHYKVLASNETHSLLELSPKTGRTHQLRVHCKLLGHPILGDTIYGDSSGSDAPELYLHASKIVLPFYDKKPPITVSAPLPLCFAQNPLTLDLEF